MIFKFKKQEFRISELSTIQYKIYTIESEDRFLSDILVIQFDGKHGFGSSGNTDSAYMEAVIEFAKSYFDSLNAIILDFRNLEYEWGDTMGRVIDTAHCNHLHAALLTSEKCYGGLHTLIEQELNAVSTEYLFQKENEAIDYLIKEHALLQKLLFASTDDKKNVSQDIHEVIKCDWDRKLKLDKNQKRRSNLIFFFICYRDLHTTNINLLTTAFKEEIKFEKFAKESTSSLSLNVLSEILLTKGSFKELELFCSEAFSIKDSYQFSDPITLPPLLVYFILTYLKNKINNTETTKDDLEKYIYCENLFLTISKSSGVSIP